MMASHATNVQRVVAILFLVLSVHTGQCEGKDDSKKPLKLLYYTASDDGSHHSTNIKIAEALVRRGHDVTFLLSNSYTRWRYIPGAEMFTFAVHQSKYTLEDRQRNLRKLSRIGLRGGFQGVWSATKLSMEEKFSSDQEAGKGGLFSFHSDECDSLLGDNETIQALREREFDLLIGEDLSSCHPLLAEMLGIRFALVSGTSIVPSKGTWYGIPHHPAYIPGRHSGLTDSMTLKQRVTNTYLSLLYGVSRRAFAFPFSRLQRKYNLSPAEPVPTMMARAELWLFYGEFGMEFARPLQPNVVLIKSPMLGLPLNEEIPKDQQEFIDAADEGVVLFTLGGHVNEMEAAQAQMFANGLTKLRQRVIWQFNGDGVSELRLGNNTMVVPWMPQKKLMEHPNTKALLSHGGLNGMFEALWYGLPVVGMPLFGDHFDNMDRAVAKGFGIRLEIATLTEDQVYQAVTRVIDDPSFRQRAQHISRIFRDDPVIPSEKAAFWISHVGRFGGEHLRPRAADLTWIENNLVDVYAFFAAILLGVLGMLYLVCRGCLWLVCACRGTKRKLKTN